MSLSQLRRVLGVGGIGVSVSLNLADASDAKNYNVQISGNVLQNSLNNLSNTVNVNTLDSMTLDASVSSSSFARYAKTESDAQHYAQAEITSFSNLKQNVLGSSSNLALNPLNIEGLEVSASIAVDQSTSISSGSILSASGDSVLDVLL